MRLVSCCLLALLLLDTTFGADITIERVFGPEVPGRYKHPSSITELESGDLYLVYYGGAGEYADDTAVYGSRRRKGTKTWTRPRVIADTPYRSEGTAVIWQAPGGRVWLYYVTRYGKTWSTSKIKARFSGDGAHSWSDSFIIAMTPGMMVRGHPIVLSSGDHLLPIYHETGHDTEMVGPDSTSLFLRYNPKTHVWTESARIRSRIGNIQPAVVEVRKDHLIAYCRRGGGYEGRPDGRIVRSESTDGGRTWSSGKDSRFPNPNAAIDFKKLQSGHLILVYNDSVVDRTPLTVAISTDQDGSYPYRRNIKEGEGSFAYPTVIQSRDGKIHLVFTSDERTVVNHAVFEEEAILRSRRR